MKYSWGVLLSGAIAGAAWLLSEPALMKRLGLSMLPLAILLGMLVGNFVYLRVSHLATRCDPGVAFSKTRLLRLGIILYGFRITFQQIAEVGLPGIVLDMIIVGGVFLSACWLGIRWLKLDPRTAMLVGAGSAVCGAAAVLATEPVVRGRSSDVAVAVSTVVLFGTVAMFLYPLMYSALQLLLPVSPHVFGVYIGATIHEVAQVVVAGKAVGDEAAAAAVIVKMIRVMLLAPFLLLLSVWLARSRTVAKSTPAEESVSWRQAVVIPWFAVYFIVVAGFNSLHWLPERWVQLLIDLDTVLLAMAMGALGVHTHFQAMRQAGVKPLALAGCLFILLITIGGGLSWLFAS